MSFILADWQVIVLCLSGLIYILSDRLYVHTIPLSGSMNRLSRYKVEDCYILVNIFYLKIKLLENSYL